MRRLRLTPARLATTVSPTSPCPLPVPIHDECAVEPSPWPCSASWLRCAAPWLRRQQARRAHHLQRLLHRAQHTARDKRCLQFIIDAQRVDDGVALRRKPGWVPRFPRSRGKRVSLLSTWHTRARGGGGTHGWHRRAPRAWHTRLGAADVAARRAGTLSKSFTAASAQPQGRDFTAPTLRTGTTALPSQTSEKEKVGRAWQPHRHPCATNAFLPWSAMRASSASPPPTLS